LRNRIEAVEVDSNEQETAQMDAQSEEAASTSSAE
jgi:hypothetical protein